MLRRSTGERVTLILTGAGGLGVGLLQASYPLAPITGAALGVGLWLALARRVQLLLAATLIALILSSSSLPFASEGWVFAGKFAMLGLLAISSLWAIAHSQPGVLKGVPLVPILGLVTFWCGLTLVTSVQVLRSLAELGSFVLILTFVTGLLVHWRNVDSVARTLSTLFFVATTVVSLGFLVGGFGIDPWEGDRFRGILAGANSAGWLLASVLPIGWHIALRAGTLSVKLMSIGLMSTSLVALLMSGSRAGLLAAISGISVAVVASRIRGSVLTLLILGIAAFSVGTSVIEQPLRENLLTLGTGSGRTLAWSEGFQLIRERPLLGWGFGTGEIIFPSAISETLPYRGTTISNGYLNAAIEGGLPLAAGLLALFTWSAIRAFRVARKGGSPGPIGGIVLGCLVGGMVESIFEVGLTTAGGMLAVPLWTSVAAAHFLVRQSSHEILHVMDRHGPGGARWRESSPE